VVGGTIVLWYKEQFGAVILFLTILFEFMIFMLVDGEILENLTFLVLSIPPLILLIISRHKEGKDEDESDYYFYR
jgi:hypothetical protein